MKSRLHILICVFIALNILPENLSADMMLPVSSNNSPVKILDTKRKCLIKLDVKKDGKAVTLFMQAQQELCFGNNTRVEFTLVDGSVLSTYASNEDNCEGKLSLGFGGIYRHEQKINALAQHPIKSMLIKDLKNEFLFYINEQQSKEITEALDKVMSRTYKTT